MSDATEERSLACRIKDEVDALVAIGQFKVVHGWGYRNHTYYARGFHNDLPCGCAIGVVSAVAASAPNDSIVVRASAVSMIQERWPEVTEADLMQLEMAFEGEDYWPKRNRDPGSEFYKLGKHIAKYAT
jgi:hypothetical protein